MQLNAAHRREVIEDLLDIQIFSIMNMILSQPIHIHGTNYQILYFILNYTIDLWDTPPTRGNGNIVGNLRASSYARIIATMGDDYKVESPINQVQGWLNKEHVKTISKKNPKTRALCE